MFRDAQEELQRLEKELLAPESENTDDPQDFDDFSIQPPSKTAMYIPDWHDHYPEEEIKKEKSPESDEEEATEEEEETAESHQSNILLIAIIFILLSAILVTVATILLRMGGHL